MHAIAFTVFGLLFFGTLRAEEDLWGHFPMGSTCYKHIKDQQLAWDDAREVCKKEGGDLAVIRDMETNQLIQLMLDKDNYLGTNANVAWIGLSVENGEVKWVDGSTPRRNLMLPPKPPTLYPGQAAPAKQCVFIDASGRWTLERCDESFLKKAPICQKFNAA